MSGRFRSPNPSNNKNLKMMGNLGMTMGIQDARTKKIKDLKR